MRNLYSKLILLLADPDITDKEFERFRNSLRNEGPELWLAEAEDLRRRLRDVPKHLLNAHHSYERQTSAELNPVIQEVIDVLLNQTRLTTGEAIELLSLRLEIPVTRSRKAFRDVVQQLAERVGHSKLLHVAHSIRNDQMHGVDRPAWPLKGAKGEKS